MLVGGILKPDSGYVSPQYNVVYDDLFTSVPNFDRGRFNKDVDPFNEAEWKNLVELDHERNLPEPNPFQNEKIPSLDNNWLAEREARRRHFIRAQNRTRRTPTRIQFETPEKSNILSPEGGSSPSSFPKGGDRMR